MIRNLFCSTILLGLVTFAASLEAQVDTVWVKQFGTEGWDFVEEIQRTRDGGYIVVGGAGNDAMHNSDLCLIRIDPSGQVLWSNRISGPENRAYGTSVQETGDGGFIVTGHHEWDIYLVKTNSEGEVEWSETFGDPGAEDCGDMVRLTEDGGYILTGFTATDAIGGEGDRDAFLIKTDAMGKVEWKENYGWDEWEGGFAVEPTPDGGYMLFGNTSSPSGGLFTDLFLIKTDSVGVVQRERIYGGWHNDSGMSARKTSDGGYIVSGGTKSYGAGGFDVYLLKFDASGDTAWTKTFGGFGDEIGFCTDVSNDNGAEVYTITGRTSSFSNNDFDLYLLRVDTDGNLIWEWVTGEDQVDEIGRCVITDPVGNLIIASDFGSFYREFFDIFLMKLRPSNGIEVSIQPTDGYSLRVGEIFEFRSIITNHSDHVFVGEYWLCMVLPNGDNILAPDGLLSFPGRTPVRIFASSSLAHDNAAWIHPKAESGTYRLIGRIGLYPDGILAEDEFEFEVLE